MKVQPATLDAYKLFHEGSQVLARMEHNGIRVDVGYLDATVAALEKSIHDARGELRRDEVYGEWRKRFGQKANLGSLVQLADVLFDGLKLPYKLDFTQSGRYRCDEAALSKVDHPFVTRYLGARKRESTLAKLLGIKREVCDGFLRPSFHLASGDEDKGGGAVSYRSSSSSPNAQNFPRRDPEMEKLIRPCFVPHQGELWLEVDFGRLEVKVAACRTLDPNLIRYEKDLTTDMHRDEAAGLFCLPVDFLRRHKDWAKKTVRDAAKNQWVFPQFYGSVYFQCAPPIWERMTSEGWVVPGTDTTLRDHLKSKGITKLGACSSKHDPLPGTFEYHLKGREKQLWGERFAVYTQWKKRTWADFQRDGWLRTLTGFVVSGYLRRNQVLNADIQGSAFHLLLQCLIWLQQAIDKYRMKSKIILQIHDSGNFSTPPREVEDLLCLTHELMTKKLPRHFDWVCVPIDVEAELAPEGGSWYDKRLVSPMVPSNGETLSWGGGKWAWV